MLIPGGPGYTAEEDPAVERQLAVGRHEEHSLKNIFFLNLYEAQICQELYPDSQRPDPFICYIYCLTFKTVKSFIIRDGPNTIGLFL